MVEKKVEKKRLSCLGGDGTGDVGGPCGKLLLLLLLLLLLFKLKNVGFFLNAFNLLCISISIVFGAFFISVLAMSFLPISSYRKRKPAIGFCVSKWKCL